MKKEIDVYEVPYVANLRGRGENVNPYTVLNVNNITILLEVPKEIAKEHFDERNYFFLACDFNEYEQSFFCEHHTIIAYDYLYRIDNNYEDEKCLKKRKKH